MKHYRIIEDNYSGYEVQVRYSWFPIIWFQANHYYWVNTWSSQEKALDFVKLKRHRDINVDYNSFFETEGNTEFERESKLLIFRMKNFFPKVVWTEPKAQPSVESRRKLFPAFNTLSWSQSKI